MNLSIIAVLAIIALLATVLACVWLADPKRAKRALERLTRLPKEIKFRKLPSFSNINFGGQDKTHEIAISKWPDASITVRHLVYTKGAGTNSPGNKVNSSIKVQSAQTDVPLGAVADEWSAAATPGQPVALQLFGVRQSTMRLVANAAGLAVGDIVFPVASGYVDKAANLTGSSNGYQVGVIVDIPNQITTAAQGDIVEVATCVPVKVAT